MKNRLIQVFKNENISLTEEQIVKFIQFASLLKEWNQKMNLTAIEDDEEIIYKHFLDSLSCLNIPIDWKNKKIIDIGTGAGFPGIPLKLALTDVELCLFDSLKKRINFLKQVINELNLTNVNCVHGRAEDYAKKDGFRDNYDIVLARAVAKLPILLELCLPYLKVGGYFIALKGPEGDEEIKESENALKTLNAEVSNIMEFNLPNVNHTRKLITFQKIADTPQKYPRKAGIPQKRPL